MLQPHELAYMSVYGHPGWQQASDPRACLANTLKSHPWKRYRWTDLFVSPRKFVHDLQDSGWCRKYRLIELKHQPLPEELFYRLHCRPSYVNFSVERRPDSSQRLRMHDSVYASQDVLADLLRLPEEILQPECAVWFTSTRFEKDEETCFEYVWVEYPDKRRSCSAQCMMFAVFVFIVAMMGFLVFCVVYGLSH